MVEKLIYECFTSKFSEWDQQHVHVINQLWIHLILNISELKIRRAVFKHSGIVALY